MRIAKTIKNLRELVSNARKADKTVGLVPTMGALHEGHLTLVRACRKECGFTVVSIFVNPTQFGPKEDFRKYPRVLAKDAVLLEKEFTDVVFAPEVPEIYPAGCQTSIKTGSLAEPLCGLYRPGHFDGVATVVLKLCSIVGPDRAYFGWKDAQQLIVIKKMAEDFNLPVKIIGCPTRREKDGLAMSSRNRYLSPAEREAAPLLYRVLRRIKADVECGQRDFSAAVRSGREELAAEPLINVQYLDAVDLKELKPAQKETRGEVMVAAAVFVGSTRLIDNIRFKLKR